MTLNELREKLADRNCRKVSETTGIAHTTLLQLRSGKHTNPSYKTLERLRAYFEDGTHG